MQVQSTFLLYLFSVLSSFSCRPTGCLSHVEAKKVYRDQLTAKNTTKNEPTETNGEDGKKSYRRNNLPRNTADP